MSIQIWVIKIEKCIQRIVETVCSLWFLREQTNIVFQKSNSKYDSSDE